MSDLLLHSKPAKSSDLVTSDFQDLPPQLQHYHQSFGPKKSDGQLFLEETANQKPKHYRSNSSKLDSFSFQSQQSEVIEEDDMLDLLSAQIDSKTLVQYYKKSLKKDSGNNLLKPVTRTYSLGSDTSMPNSAKLPSAKTKATIMLVERLSKSMRSHFRVFALKCSFEDVQDPKKDQNNSHTSSFYDVKKILNNINNLSLTEHENSPYIGTGDHFGNSFGTPNAKQHLPSFPVSALNSPHNVLDNRSKSPGHNRPKNESRYRELATMSGRSRYLGNSQKTLDVPSAENLNEIEGGEGFPKSGTSIGVETNEYIFSVADHGDIVNQPMQEEVVKRIRSQGGDQSPKKSKARKSGSNAETKVNAVARGKTQSQEMLPPHTQVPKREENGPMHIRLGSASKTVKSELSLDSHIDLKQKPEPVELNGLKGYFISQGCTEKSISHCRADSYSSTVSNDVFFKNVYSKSIIQGSPSVGLSPQARLSIKDELKFQDLAQQALALERQELRMTQIVGLLSNGLGVKRAFKKIKDWIEKSPTSLLAREGSLCKTGAFPTFTDLPQPGGYGFALDLDRIPETDSRDITNNRAGPSYRPALVNLIDYGNEMRKMQSRMKGIMSLEMVFSQLKRKVYRSSFESLYFAHGEDMLSRDDGIPSQTYTEKSTTRTFLNRGRQHNRMDPNSSFGAKLRDGEEIDVASLEEKLERSLEKKLESRLAQNLDEKLRGRLQRELIKLFSHEFSDIKKRETSQDRSIQTDWLGSSDSKLFEFEKQTRKNLQEAKQKDVIGKIAFHENGSQQFNTDQKTPYFYNLAQFTSFPQDINSFTPSTAVIKEFSARSQSQDDTSHPTESNARVGTQTDGVNFTNNTESANGDAADIVVRKNEPVYYSPRQNNAEEKEKKSSFPASQAKYFIRNPYSEKNDNAALNRTTDEKMHLQGLGHKVTNPVAQVHKKEAGESGTQVSKPRSASSSKEAGLKYSLANAKVDYSLYPVHKNVMLGKVLEKLAVERMRSFFYKIQRPYLMQSFRRYRKKNTLNYLLFAKKVEKLYITRIRSGFTKLCLKNAGASQQRTAPSEKLVQRFSMRMKKSFFANLRSYSLRKLNLQNSLGKVVSLLHAKKLRMLSEAFYYTASYSLVRKEYMLNLTLMCLQLSEMRKSKMRSIFTMLKQANRKEVSPQAKAMKTVLKHVLQDTKLRLYFGLKQAFMRWKGAANNVSTSLMHEARSFEHAKVMKIHLITTLKNIFSSRDRINKCHAFYELKNNTKHSKGALALYGALNDKIGSRLRSGYESITKSERTEHETQRKLERLCDIFKTKILRVFMKIFIHSQTLRPPAVDLSLKKGLLRLCVVAEDIKHNLLMHGLKMLELYNIHKRNQKSLYVNLALKLYLLFDEKEMSEKKAFLNALSFSTEKGAFQQKTLGKLLRRVHTKNVSYYFNRFKNEVVNIKLNHSMVNLAIKNIILAVEKMSKLQRLRKTMALRKLSMLLWDKQFDRENPTISTYKESSLKLKDFSMTESIEFGVFRFNEEEGMKKMLRLVQWLEDSVTDHHRSGFEAIRSMSKRNKLTERLQVLGGRLFKKIIYKRSFLSFAQIKYFVQKKQQRAQNLKLSVLFPMLKNLDKTMSRNKKLYFKQWRATVQLESQSLMNKVEKYSQIQKKRILDKWKRAMNNRMQKKAQIQAAAGKLEEIWLKKLAKFSVLAFKRMRKCKGQLKMLQLSNRSQADQIAAYKKPATKLSKARSPQPGQHTQKKSSISIDKKVTSKPMIPLGETSPTSPYKKGLNRPQIDDSSVASPRSRFSRGSNLSLMKESIANSLSTSHASSQASSKMSTPSHNLKKMMKNK